MIFWIPGLKASTQCQLENYVTQMLSGEDVYSSERKKYRRFFLSIREGVHQKDYLIK